MLKYLLIFLLLGCTTSQPIANRVTLVTMTNQQQTDAIIALQKQLRSLNKKQFKDDGTTVSFADTVRINVLIAGRAYITKTGLIPEQEQTLIEDATFVRKYLEFLSDSLYRANDSLKNIIDKK